MCRRNISLALGEGACGSLARFFPERLQSRTQRVRTDNKLDRHEWLRLADGRLIKTDALDHHQAHDLIGCQSIEWDVAGAIAEFDLQPDEQRRLIDATGVRVDPTLLDFFRIAYSSFRMGAALLASESAGPAQAGHLRLSAERYAERLEFPLRRHASAPHQAEVLV
jgi:hypothetical protein